MSRPVSLDAAIAPTTVIDILQEGGIFQAVHFKNNIVSLCRLLGIFSGQCSYGGIESQSDHWVVHEQMRR